MRRLPVYLCLDSSYSMSGAPIEAVNKGLQALVDMLRQDPFALETVYLSVIQFSSEARHTVPLCDLMSFQPPIQAHHVGREALQVVGVSIGASGTANQLRDANAFHRIDAHLQIVVSSPIGKHKH